MLDLLNAELSPERHGSGLRSQKMGEERNYAVCYAVITRMTAALRSAAISHFNVLLIIRGNVIRQCPYITTVFAVKRGDVAEVVKLQAIKITHFFFFTSSILGKNKARKISCSKIQFCLTHTVF